MHRYDSQSDRSSFDRLLGTSLCALVLLGACNLLAQEPAISAGALWQANAELVAGAATGLASPAQTKAILKQRLQLMETLFRYSPQKARSYVLDATTRAALVKADPSYAALLEQDGPQTGELAAAVADDFEHGTSTTHYMLHRADSDIDLSFAITPVGLDRLLHHTVTAQGVSIGSVMATDSVRESPQALSSAESCGPSEGAGTGISLTDRSITIPGLSARTSTAPATCSTFGNQRIAVLILKFPSGSATYPTGFDQASYWNTVLFGPNPSVNGFWNEVSYGQTSATGDVYGPFTLPQTYDCTTTTDMATAAVAAAAGTVDFTQYNRIVMVFPTGTCSFGGYADIGCRGASTTISHQYSYVWIPITPSYDTSSYYSYLFGVSAHELGHNLGLGHANTLGFTPVALGAIDATVAYNTEYGDLYSDMGANNGGPYSAEHRAKILGWIPSSDETDVLASGSYTLVPAENSSGLRALRILRDPVSDSWLWLEFHQSIGYYTPANLAQYPGSTHTTGAEFRYENGSLDSLHAYRLDMQATPNYLYDGTLPPGSSWSDPYSLLTLTVGNQTSSTLGVSVSYDTACATVSLSASTLPATGGSGTLTISAPSTCSWTVSSAASWISFPGTTSGSGNATVPFAAAANSGTSQRSTQITAQRQSLPLTQKGTVVSTLAVAPSYGSSTVGTIIPFAFSFDDAIGKADLTNLDINFAASIGGQGCTVSVGTASTGSFYLGSGNNISGGSSGVSSTAGCNLYGAGSSVTWSGSSLQVMVSLSFPATALGAHSISAYAAGNTATGVATVPLGTWIVINGVSVFPFPASANQSVTVGVTLNGIGTSFDRNSVVSSAGGDITISGVSVTSPTSITANVAISPTAATGPHTLTVTTGTQSVSTLFFVTPRTPTTTSLNASPTTVTFGGGYLNLSSSVSPSAATGMLSFLDGKNVLSTVNLSSGLASLSTNTLPVGTHTITAAYAGDSNYAPSTSTAATVTINPVATVTALTSNAATVLPGQPVTLTAKITPASLPTALSGSVQFYDGATLLSTVSVAALAAGYTVPSVTLGSHTYTAVYSGDAVYAGSSSAGLNVAASYLVTATTLTTSAASVLPSQSATLTVKVTASSGTPGGNVTIKDGALVFATVPLASGVATYPLSGLAVGTHSYTASYAGDNVTFGSSVSLPTVVMVAKGSTSVNLTTTAAPLYAGGSVTFTAAVAPAPAGGTLSGDVTFSDGGVVLATQVLGNGAAIYTTSSLATGLHSITATYAGSSDYNGSASTAQIFTVMDFGITAAATSFTLTAGGTATSGLTIAPGPGGFNQPITLNCVGAPASSTCAVAPASVTPGSANIIATVTLATTVRSSAISRSGMAWLLLALLPGLMAFRRRSFRAAALAIAFFGVLGAVSGCSSGNSSGSHTPTGTPAGTYTLTVGASAVGNSTLTHTATISVTVN